MRDLLYILFFAGLAAVPAGFLFLPLRIGFPIAIVGGLVLHFSHYQLGRLRKQQEPPRRDVLDDDLFIRRSQVEED